MPFKPLSVLPTAALTTALTVALTVAPATVRAETIRVAIGTQDTTINCATGGLLIRELKLLDKYLPRTGKYKDVTYDVQWKNFTSGPPLTNEMVADKLDIGAMADFPGSLNAAAFQKAGKKSLFIAPLSGNAIGTGNGIVVPADSPIASLYCARAWFISAMRFSSSSASACCSAGSFVAWFWAKLFWSRSMTCSEFLRSSSSSFSVT